MNNGNKLVGTMYTPGESWGGRYNNRKVRQYLRHGDTYEVEFVDGAIAFFYVKDQGTPQWGWYIDLSPSEGSDEVNPNHYQFPGGIEARHISAHLTSFGGQALQYIARATRLDNQVKGDPVTDLKKAIRLLEWEIERIEG